MDVGGLTAFPFRSDRFVVVAQKGHPLSEGGSTAFSEVLACDLVGLDRASSLQRFLADKAARGGRPLRLRVQLRSFDAVCRLVEQGVGVGVVPQTTARRAAQTMALEIIELTDDWAVRELKIVVRDLAALRPYAQALVGRLRPA